MRKLFILTFCVSFAVGALSQTDTTAIFHKADSLNELGATLRNERKYNEALDLFNQAAEMTKDVAGGLNSHYATTLGHIAMIYDRKADYQNALKCYTQAMEIRKKVLGEDNPDYASSLDDVGIEYATMGDYQTALEYMIRAMEIRKKVLGEEHHDYASSLNNIGVTYYYLGDEQNSLKYYLQAMELKKKTLGEEHPDYAMSLNNVGIAYKSMGDYQSALKYYLQAKEITAKSYGEETPRYASILNNIAICYQNLKNYQKALSYNKQALKIREKVLGVNHPDYAYSLNNIGTVYENIGDYQTALKYYMEALEIRGMTLGTEHPKYAVTLNDIGGVYFDMGDYQNALKYFLQALEIRKKTIGEEHPEYASLLNDIGIVYNDMGDYQNALKYLTQALEIQKKVYGEDHHECASTLGNIGLVYDNMGDYQNALKYQMQSIEIKRKNWGEDNLNYARSLNNIGIVYNNMGDSQNALKYYNQSMETIRKIQGEEHPDYASSQNNIGSVYDKMGDYQSAMKYYSKALEIRKKVLGEEHPLYALTIYNIGRAYFGEADYPNAIKANKDASDICKRNLIRNFSFMTAHEREAYWSATNKYFYKNINYMYHLPDDTLATSTSYDAELITKGLLLASEINMTNIIMESGDSTLISDYENLKTMHLQLDKELEKPTSERVVDCDSLNEEIQKVERRVVEKSKEFGDITNFIKIDWKEVQNSLKPNDVAIEFSNFTENDTTKFVALVLTKDMKAPVCVPLFDQSEMQKLQRGIVPTKSETQMEDENRGASTVAAKRQGIYESTGLYNLLWKPLEKYFPENPRIYFAPSGMLHQIAVEYAPIDKEKTISDKYEIYRMSSTRFLAMEYMPKPMKNSVLYGGIYYDSDTTTMKQESDRYSTRSATNTTAVSISRNGDRGSLSYLPGTKTEVENIVGKMKKRKISTTIFEGSQANEESFKALSGKEISTLHVATHGFFLPSDEKMSGDQSLIQSGLLMSGANLAWQNMPVPEGIEDGILTAKEISFMDLRKTDLVVLSACQTALGEITGEGVFGLQRGFKKAGVHTIIMSLWPVDDNATLLMMTEFYTNLTKGMSKREAFLAAQNKVKTTEGFANPRFWAAFIMLDGNEK